ncbi:MAG: phosphate ABC transporter substrate-binding protein [Endozoicomonas sp.]
MKKAILSILGTITFSAVLVGCGGAETQNSGSISLSGSTSVSEVMAVLGETWEKNSDIAIEVQGTGSSAGIKAVNNGTSQIGLSSRLVKDSEVREGMEQVILARDGIAVVVNNDNRVSDLKPEQISAIYNGEVTNWQEVGGQNRPIVVVTREPASGTRGAFEEIMKLRITDANGNRVSSVTNIAQVAPSNGAVKTTVAQNIYAVGYISLGSVDDSLKSLKVGGIAATRENIKAGKYKVARPFVLLYNTRKLTEASQSYLEWVLSEEGQAVVAEKGYIPVI